MEFEIQKKTLNNQGEKSINGLKQKKIKVAAYARVSLDIYEQQLSLESQKRYYKHKIEMNENWIFVGVYADEGISGTQMKKRVNFSRMIDDALDGNIDLILTKSISRFARNTVDTLDTVRKLKDKNIGVYFEEESINTLDMTGELLLTILSSIAQQEIQNLSSHVTLAHKMLMEKGVCIGKPSCYGFDYNVKTKELTINEKEAKVVRKIFKWYLDGCSFLEISKKLEKEKIPASRGKPIWNETSIKQMLVNEKYVGDLLQGKHYTLDSISHKSLKNNGERDMYLARNHHEPIISREDFEKAQELIAKTNIKYKTYFKTSPRTRYPFSGIFFCGFCGSRFIKKDSNNIKKYQCTIKRTSSDIKCNNNKAVYYETLEKVFCEVVKRLIKKLNKINRYDDNIKSKLKYVRRILLNKNLLKDSEEKDSDDFKSIDDDKLNKKEIRHKRKIDINLIREIIEYGIIGGYVEDSMKDPFMIRFIIKTDDSIKYDFEKHVISRSYILDRNNIEKCNDKIFTLLDFLYPQKMLHYEIGSDGEKHQYWINEIRVRVEIDLEGWSNSGSN